MTTFQKRSAWGCAFGTAWLCLIVGAQPAVTPPIAPPTITLNQAELPPEAIQHKLPVLLKAIQEDDYDAFTSALTADFKAALPLSAFEEMRTPLAARLAAGYDLRYFGEIKKHNYTTYAWRIVFRDPNDANEILATVTYRNDPDTDPENAKVAGFSLE